MSKRETEDQRGLSLSLFLFDAEPRTNASSLVSSRRRCLKKAIEVAECLDVQSTNVLLVGMSRSPDPS